MSFPTRTEEKTEQVKTIVPNIQNRFPSFPCLFVFFLLTFLNLLFVMSTASKRGCSSPSSSFESPYVSIELLSYLKPEQKTPFQVLREVVMPEFKRHLSNGKQFLPPPEETHNGNGNIITVSAADDAGSSVTEEDSGNYSNLHAVFDEIQRDVNYIYKACGKLERWEALVNSEIKGLVFQRLDDGFKERMNTLSSSLDNTVRTKFEVQLDKLLKVHKIISDLKNSICSQPELAPSADLESESFKSATSSMTRQGIVNFPVQLPVVNIGREIAEVSTFEEIQAIYNGLDVTLKLCLLCFSVFPENAIIKKKVLVHWWVGEGFIDFSSSITDQGGKTVEQIGYGYFKDLIAKRIIEPVYKKRRPGADSCKMNPLIRYAVINLAERAGFVDFDSDRNPTAKFTDSRRAFLVRTKERSSMEELTNNFNLKQENVQTLFNVSETNFGFRQDWFSKMKYVKVLQLGRWQSSVKHVIEAEDSGFLKGLKKMKQLRYLSLRGVSRITELPDSICKLRNLRILNLNGCRDLEKLPDGIGSLDKLTHLDMYECFLISRMPRGLALLSELQVLKGFVVGKKPSSGEDQDHCKLKDLAKLEKLKTLRIHMDKSSSLTDQVQELSCLEQFKKLRSLSISWSRIYGSSAPKRNIQRMITTIYSMRSVPRTLPSFSSPSLPVLLEKLDLHYFPESTMPEWLVPDRLKQLKKLYIRGGVLGDLGQECSTSPWSSVKVLRLKFLSKLQIEWREVQALFPNLVYLEKFKCPKLSFFPCDQNGVWEKAEDHTN